MKCRGDFVLTKEYDSQLMNTFEDFEILKLEIGILFYYFSYFALIIILII